MKNIFLYEFFKSLSSKMLYIILGLILIIFLTFVFIHLNDVTVSRNLPAFDREALRQFYLNKMVENNLNISSGNLEFFQIKSLLEQNTLYQFYIDTNTVEYDYFSFVNLGVKTEGIVMSSFVFSFSEFMKYPIVLIPIISSLSHFTIDFENGNIKNILSSKKGRKDIFNGKHLSGVAEITIIFLIMFIIGSFMIVIESPSQLILINIDGKYYSDTLYSVFAIRSVSYFIFALFTYELMTLLGIFLKNGFLSSITILFAYLFLLVIFVGLTQMGFVKSNYFSMLAFPITNILECGAYGYISYSIILLLSTYAIFTIGIYYTNLKLFLRKDF